VKQTNKQTNKQQQQRALGGERKEERSRRSAGRASGDFFEGRVQVHGRARARRPPAPRRDPRRGQWDSNHVPLAGQRAWTAARAVACLALAGATAAIPDFPVSFALIIAVPCRVRCCRDALPHALSVQGLFTAPCVRRLRSTTTFFAKKWPRRDKLKTRWK